MSIAILNRHHAVRGSGCEQKKLLSGSLLAALRRCGKLIRKKIEIACSA
jgi:hypothetical protein